MLCWFWFSLVLLASYLTFSEKVAFTQSKLIYASSRCPKIMFCLLFLLYQHQKTEITIIALLEIVSHTPLGFDWAALLLRLLPPSVTHPVFLHYIFNVVVLLVSISISFNFSCFYVFFLQSHKGFVCEVHQICSLGNSHYCHFHIIRNWKI